MANYNLLKQKNKNTADELEKIEPESKSEQLNFELKENITNKFFNWKRKIVNIEDKMKFSIFFRSVWIWLIFFIALTSTIIGFALIFKYWNIIPNDIPIFSIFNTSRNKLVPKPSVFLIALLPLLTTIVTFILFYYIFRTYERLKFLVFQIILLISIFSVYGLFSLIRGY